MAYDVFKDAVLKLYPSAAGECAFTFGKVDLIISEQLHLGIYMKEDLAAYHRQFLMIMQYLISKN